MFTSLQEAQTFCKDKGLVMVDFKMIDLMGRWRRLTIPIERFTEEIFTSGIGFDSSNYGYAPVEKSDMVFIPDLSTAFVEPFAEVPTLSMIGDVYVIDEPPRRFSQDPRAIAAKAEEYMRSTGVADTMRTGPEFEFYVFNHISYETSPQSSGYRIDARQAVWNAKADDEPNQGYKVPTKGGYHMAAPWDVLYDLRSRMARALEERGIAVKYHHHEVGGPGQLELEVESGPMRTMADAAMLIKYLVKNIAFAEGKSATFMPKPIFGEAGNGMHVHIHLFRDGKPVFYDPNGYSGLSETALFFIGGLLEHAPALCGLTNPSTNSYKRLVPGYEAPVSICYATSNRSAVVRIPDYARTPEQKRFEIRSPDATANPYFAFAAILMAGMDGIMRRLDPKELGYGPYDVNLYHLSAEEQKKIRSLPRTLDEALDALEADHEFLLQGDVFPKELIEVWIENKRREAREINQIPHPAEFAAYYDL